jgi:3'-phosphoadenosine 5'-phosphosulfate sulfotransferase
VIKLQLSATALNKAKELLDRAMEQATRAKSITVRIEEIGTKLNDLRNNSRVSVEHSNEALRRNRINNQTITEIKVFFPLICSRFSLIYLYFCQS